MVDFAGPTALCQGGLGSLQSAYDASSGEEDSFASSDEEMEERWKSGESRCFNVFHQGSP